MNFYKKIFFTFIITIILISSICIWGYHFYATKNATKNFEEKYELLTDTISETLNQLDKSADLFMLNSARLLQKIENESKNDTHWKEIAKKLNLTHIFIANSNGDFIVSTNEPPKKIPNLLSFCESYSNILNDIDNFETTPIIPPTPEPYPYKFLIVPNLSKTKFLEVAVKVDFIGNTLKKVLERDKNILKIQLFTPNGINLGSFGPKAEKYKRFKIDRSEFRPNELIHKKNLATAYTKVPANITTCCQCNESGLSDNNKYYYLLKTEIDKTDLNNDYKNILLFSLIMQLFSLIAGWFLSKKIASSLSGRISNLDRSINQMIKSNSISPITINGNDEISSLTKNFNSLLNKISLLNKEIIESKDLKLRFKFARMIAHDLAAPIEAISFLKDRISSKSDKEKSILNSISDKLTDLTKDLRNTILEMNQGELNIEDHPILNVDIVKATKEVTSIFQSFTLDHKIEYCVTSTIDSFIFPVNSYLYSRVLLNILKNSFEAVSQGGKVEVYIHSKRNDLEITVLNDLPLKDQDHQNYGLGLDFIQKVTGYLKIDYLAMKSKNNHKTTLIFRKNNND